jgi:imidazolonepropionase-like amidohydrolase
LRAGWLIGRRISCKQLPTAYNETIAVKVCAALFCLAIRASAQSPETGVLLRGGTIHTISGPVIEGGSVLIRDGKIVAVGKNFTAPEGYRVIDVAGRQVYPGMIDAASLLGIDAGDAREPGAIHPQLRAATAVNPASEQIPASRANGVTSVISMPEGELIAGQMSLIHLDGSANDRMTVVPLAAIHLRFPAIETRPPRKYENDDADDDPAEPEPIPIEEARAEYDRRLAALEAFFEEARQYRASRPPTPDLRLEAMLPVLEGKAPMFVTAVREREIREAIEFAERQKIRIILADAYEAYKVIPLIKAHDIPVVLGPTFSLPLDPDDLYDRSFTTPAELKKAGVRFAIASFSARQSRNLPFQAAAAVPFGLEHEDAYRAVSLSAAEIFGAASRLGSIEEGKLADLIVADGDPLEVTTKLDMVFIGGRQVSLETRQKQLYDKYAARPQ